MSAGNSRYAWMKFIRVALVFSCFLTTPFPARADEPYVTDDASVLDRGACQLELGKRTLRDSHQWYLLPACNLFWDVEITLGRTGFSGPLGEGTLDTVIQAKGLWLAVEPNRFGFGWNIGTEVRRHPRRDERRLHDITGTLIASRSFFDDRLIAHANGGVRWLRDEGRGAVTLGVLAEVNVTSRLALLAETYDTSRTRRFYQAGLRLAIVPEHVTLHVAAGGESNFSSTRQWTIGLHLVSPPLFR